MGFIKGASVMHWNFEKEPDRIKTAPEEELRAFLRADAEKTDTTDREMEIVFQVTAELTRRREARGEPVNAKAALKIFRRQYRQKKN